MPPTVNPPVRDGDHPGGELNSGKPISIENARGLALVLHGLLNETRTWGTQDNNVDNRVKLHNHTVVVLMCLRNFPDLEVSDPVANWLELWGQDAQYRTLSDQPFDVSRLISTIFQEHTGPQCEEMDVDLPPRDRMEIDPRPDAALPADDPMSADPGDKPAPTAMQDSSSNADTQARRGDEPARREVGNEALPQSGRVKSMAQALQSWTAAIPSASRRPGEKSGPVQGGEGHPTIGMVPTPGFSRSAVEDETESVVQVVRAEADVTSEEKPDIGAADWIAIIICRETPASEEEDRERLDETEEKLGDDGKRRMKLPVDPAPQKRLRSPKTETIRYPRVGINFAAVPEGCTAAYFVQPCAMCARQGVDGSCVVQMDAIHKPTKSWRGPWSACVRCNKGKKKCIHSTRTKEKAGSGEGDEGSGEGVDGTPSTAASHSGSSTTAKSATPGGGRKGLGVDRLEAERAPARTVGKPPLDGAGSGPSSGREKGKAVEVTAAVTREDGGDGLVRGAQGGGRTVLQDSGKRTMKSPEAPSEGADLGGKTVEARLATVEARLKDLRHKDKAHDKALSKGQAEIGELRETVTEIDLALRAVEDDTIPEISEAVATLREEFEVHDDVCGQPYQRLLEDHKRSQKKLLEDHERARQKSEEGRDNRVDRVTDRVNSLATQTNGLAHRVSTLEQTGGDLLAVKDEVKAVAVAVKRLEARKGTKEGPSATVKSDIDDLKLAFKRLEACSATRTELTESKLETNRTVEGLSVAIKELGQPPSQDDMDTLEGMFLYARDEARTAIEELEKGANALEGRLEEVLCEAKAEGEQRALAERERTEREKARDRAREGFQEWASARVSALEGQVSSAAQSVEALSTSLESMEERFEATSETRHDALRLTVESTNARLLALSEKGDSGVQKLATRMDAIEQNMRELKTAVDKMTENVQAALTLSFTSVIESHLRTLATGIAQQQQAPREPVPPIPIARPEPCPPSQTAFPMAQTPLAPPLEAPREVLSAPWGVGAENHHGVMTPAGSQPIREWEFGDLFPNPPVVGAPKDVGGTNDGDLGMLYLDGREGTVRPPQVDEARSASAFGMAREPGLGSWRQPYLPENAIYGQELGLLNNTMPLNAIVPSGEIVPSASPMSVAESTWNYSEVSPSAHHVPPYADPKTLPEVTSHPWAGLRHQERDHSEARKAGLATVCSSVTSLSS